MEDLPEERMSDLEADVATIEEMRAHTRVFAMHEHVLLSLAQEGEHGYEV